MAKGTSRSCKCELLNIQISDEADTAYRWKWKILQILPIDARKNWELDDTRTLGQHFQWRGQINQTSHRSGVLQVRQGSSSAHQLRDARQGESTNTNQIRQGRAHLLSRTGHADSVGFQVDRHQATHSLLGTTYTESARSQGRSTPRDSRPVRDDVHRVSGISRSIDTTRLTSC